MKHLFSMLLLWCAAACLSGCSKSDGDDEPFTPDVSVPDPSGTISVSMRNDNSGGTRLGSSGIHIDKADNFAGAWFASLGKVKGLGNVTVIPKTGWSEQLAVTPGQGLVAWSDNRFYRIYVVDYTTNVANEIIGADVKYQTPFAGGGTIKLNEQEVTFEAAGGTRDLPFANSEIAAFSVAGGDNRLLTVEVLGDKTYSFLPTGIRLVAGRNDQFEDRHFTVTVTPVEGAKIELPVTLKAAVPDIELGDDLVFGSSPSSWENPRTVPFSSDFAAAELQVSSSAAWCGVELVDGQTLAVRVDENPTPDARTAEVTVAAKDGSVAKSIRVTQEAPTLELDSSHLEMQATEMYRTRIYVRTENEVWGIESDAEWISVENDNNRYAGVQVAENTTGAERTGTVTVYLGASPEGNLTRTLTVTQQPHTFALSSETLAFDRTQQHASVTLTTTASECTFASDQPWCGASRNGATITVRVESNDTGENRSAVLTVTLNDGQAKTIAVDQGRYAPGDAYDEAGVQGLVSEVTGHHGKIVSSDEAMELMWSTETVATGATDRADGAKNTTVIRAIPNWQTLYPAFAWCEAKNTGGITGWYLPAVEEVRAAYAAGLLSGSYWTSTEESGDGRNNSCYMPSINYRTTKKVTQLKVRAMYAY